MQSEKASPFNDDITSSKIMQETVAIWVRMTLKNRIKSIFRSDNTNCKNDIQLMFDELRVNKLPLTPTGVMSEANSGIALHKVHSSDSFSAL